MQILISRKVVITVGLTTTVLIAVSELFSLVLESPITALGWTAIPLFVLTSYLLTFMHEKIGRCTSRMQERVLRFAGYGWFVLCGPGLYLVAIHSQGWAVVMLTAIQTYVMLLAASSCLVPLLYRLDPEGPGRYFSISRKFDNVR